MKTIFKYAVPMSEDFTLHAPKGAEFFSVQLQGNEVQMWARVDPEAPKILHRFGVHGTGHYLNPFTAKAPAIGTFQLAGGSLVFHLFGGVPA